jgi:hypothetical protein
MQMLMACDLTSADSRRLLPRQAPGAPVNSLPVQQDTNPVLLLHGKPQLLLPPS